MLHHKIARHFLSTPIVHKRDVVSSRISEMFNNIIKKKSRNAFYMLRECFIKATEWFQESSSRVYPKEQIITDVADDKINKIIIKMIYKQFYDDLYHQVDENGKCNCTVKADLGLPCPKQIEYLKDLGIEVNDMVSKDWLCSTYRKAYDTIAQKDNNPQSFQMKIQNTRR